MGKTEAILCMIGARFDDGPLTPAIIVQPTAKLAGSFADDRLRKLIANCPDLDAKLEHGQRDRKNEKYLSGVRIGMAWAGSPVELASHPCGLVFCDEVDRFEADVGGEGDPVTLARARGKNYARFKMVLTSTPTIEDASAIQFHFDDGSREMLEWQCPHCSEWFRPQSKDLIWDSKATLDQIEQNAALHCPHCGAGIAERDKRRMNENHRFTQYLRTADGDYHPDPDPPPLGPHRSFWISGLASPWCSFGQIARELAAAYRSRDPARIQSVINTFAGETWRTRGDAPDWAEVMSKRTHLKPDLCPPGALGCTMGVDVQKNELYWVIRAWGVNMTSWLVAHGVMFGSTEFDDVWQQLSRRLTQPIQTLPVQRCFIDSGYRPGGDEGYRRPDHQVYLWCRRHPGLAHPTKGHDTQSRPLFASTIDISHQGQTLKNALQLWHLDTDYLKTELYTRIRWPEQAETGGWWVHADVDEDYCRQVVSEECLTKASGHRQWIHRRSKPNHYLDAEVLALAAAHSLHYQSLEAPKSLDPVQKHTPRERSSHFSFRRL